MAKPINEMTVDLSYKTSPELERLILLLGEVRDLLQQVEVKIEGQFDRLLDQAKEPVASGMA